MPALLFLHGLASAPGGRKPAAIREALAPRGWSVLNPDMNVPSFEELSFEAMVGAALDAARAAPPDVVIGSSLGALVALAAAQRGVDVPLVLVAPALGIAATWREKLPDRDPVPFFHRETGRIRPIHRAFFEELARVEPSLRPPRRPVSVLMGRADESVPFAGVETTWRRWSEAGFLTPDSEFVAIEGGDHSLLAHVPRIVEAVLRRAGGTSGS